MLSPRVPTTGEAIDQAKGLLVSERDGPPVSDRALIAAAVLAGGAATVLGLAVRRRAERRHPEAAAAITCSDRLKDGAAIVAGSVLFDSAIEHFRGNYNNRAMYVAPATASIALVASLNDGIPRPIRTCTFSLAGAIGIAGLGFHAYNIMKRPGGLSWNNVFYAAPALAPGAIALSGLLGYASSHIENICERAGSEGTQHEVGPVLALLMAGGIIATTAEVALLHFRGAFHDPFMYVPVVVPPTAASLLTVAAVKPTEGNLRRARRALTATAAIGMLGAALHVYGVQRNMGGWRNWMQNLFVGPPIPAPPSFTGLAIAGLGALHLLKRQ